MVGILEIFQEAVAAQFEQLWNVYLGTALAVSAAIVALGYAFGELLAAPEVRSWVRGELKELVRTVAIIALLWTALGILHILFVALVGDAPFAYARSFLAGVHTELSHIFFYLTGVFWGWIPVTALSLPVPIPFVWKFASFDYGTAYGHVLDIIQFVFTPLTMAMFAVIAEAQLLDFIEKVALTIVLPTGILLRAFVLTRRTGSTLIALSLTAYIAFPTALSLSGIIWHNAFETLAAEALERGVVITHGDAPQISLNLSIVRHFPPPELYFVAPDEFIRWEILSHRGIWRVWQKSNCEGALAVCATSEGEQPLPEAVCDCWKIAGVGTYRKVANGTYVAGKLIEFSLRKRVERVEGEFEFIIDVHEKNVSYVEPTGPEPVTGEVRKWIPLGTDTVKIYIGDPCAGLVNKIQCALGLIQSAKERERITPEIDVKSLMAGALEGPKRLVTNPHFVIAPPVGAALVCYDLVEKLPYIMFPVSVVVISLVLIGIIVMSTYRGLAEALGGEPVLFGIGKIL